MPELPSTTCTGCGTCSFVCPKKCISMQENDIGLVLPIINVESCISCHICEHSCPILNVPALLKPMTAYAGWSVDVEERKQSASGGIAAELYKFALMNGYNIVGASQNSDFSVTHKMTDSLTELPPFKNSKYVFSSVYNVFADIKQKLYQNKKVLFIGLPCQVAALKSLFVNNENLLLVDLVCHGVTPYSFLKQHIELICKQKKKVAKKMSFRDPQKHTYTYTFTLYDEKKQIFYSKRTKDGDSYQLGYHRAVTYRENCYHCLYAQSERCGDITLGDYHGLGTLSPCSFSDKKVSLILINSERGALFLNSLVELERIVVYERPLLEPLKNEPQLCSPSIKNKCRLKFEKNILINGGKFEKAMKGIVLEYNFKNILLFPYRFIRKVIKLIVVKR